MGRLLSLMIFLVALQAILILFEGTTPNATAIWTMARDPFSWYSATIIAEIVAIAVGLGAAAIMLGNAIGIKTDFMIFAVLISSLMTFGAIISDFAGVIGKDLSGIFCAGTLATDWASCPAAVWLVTITVGMLGLYYVFTVLEWWKNSDR